MVASDRWLPAPKLPPLPLPLPPCFPGQSVNAPTHTWVGSNLGTSQRSLIELSPYASQAALGFVAADRDGSITGVRGPV